MTRASDAPLLKWSVSLALGAMVVVTGACAPNGTGADRDSGAKPRAVPSHGVAVCEAGDGGWPGQPGQPGRAEAGRSAASVSEGSGFRHEAITAAGEPGDAESGRPGEAGTAGQPGSCGSR